MTLMRVRESVGVADESSASPELGSCGSSTATWSDPEDNDNECDEAGHVMIQGPSGSVRGRRHSVRASVRALLSHTTTPPLDCDQLRTAAAADDDVVVYTTSMGVIRNTFDNCRKLR